MLKFPIAIVFQNTRDHYFQEVTLVLQLEIEEIEFWNAWPENLIQEHLHTRQHYIPLSQEIDSDIILGHNLAYLYANFS